MRMIAVTLLAAACLLAPRDTAAGDFQLWSEAGVRARLHKRLRLKIDALFRFDRNLSATESVAPQVALSWRAWKFLRLEAGYRTGIEPIESREPTYLDIWHRFHLDLRWRLPVNPVRFRYRLRYQEQFGWPWTDDPDLVARHTMRHKLDVEWKAGAGLEPFTAAELFTCIADPDGPLHKWRITAGLDLETGDHVFTLFYRFEDMLDDPEDPDRHILGVEYHVDL